MLEKNRAPARRPQGYRSPGGALEAIGMSRYVMAALMLLLTAPIQPARADQDQVDWMARKLLSGKDVLDYELALEQFAKVSDPRVLPTLLKLLDKDATNVRAEAAGVMWHYNTKEVRSKLVEMINDLDTAVRIEAAKSLCLMGYTANHSVIVEALGDKQQPVRSRALRALAKLEGEPSQKAAAKLVKSRSAIDRVWAAYALYQLGVDLDDRLTELEHQLLSFPKAAWLARKQNPTVADLARAAELGAKNKGPRLAAADALSRIGDDRAIAVLVKGTADRASLHDRSGALRLLLRHRDDAAVACAQALADERVLVRLGAAQAGGRLKLSSHAAKSALAEALGRAVTDSARLVRVAALRAIGVQAFISQVDAIVRALRSEDARTRRAAALAMGKLGAAGSDRGLEVLLQGLGRETDAGVRRALYLAIEALHSERAVRPMLSKLKDLFKRRRTEPRASEELPLCIRALAAAGEPAAAKVLAMLPKLEGEKRKLLVEVLARTGSEKAIDFFMDQLRESPPRPDAPAVRFFDSLDARFVPELEKLIERETAMWIRVILARALFRLGKPAFGRGILWGLKNEDVYYRRLAAALCNDLKLPGSLAALSALLTDEPETALYAARALMSNGSRRAVDALVRGLGSESLRARRKVPVTLFWEGQRTARNPFAKEVDNDRVWVLFAEDRLGGKLDLFLTWSADGKTWTDPVFTGLTSFADPTGRVPPPTFSLKVRGRKITIGLTRTFAQGANPANPRFKTLQRVHQHELKDFFRDRDSDGLKDMLEQTRFTNPTRRDTDGDGLDDGEDKNPLARPVDPDRDVDLIRVLAFSHALLVEAQIPTEGRLLVVESPPGARRPPELPTWPWLVLHLRPDQSLKLWRETGGGYPRIAFGKTEFKDKRSRAIQELEVNKAPGDVDRFEVDFRKRDDTWVVSSFRAVN